jgi:hypothetical protein
VSLHDEIYRAVQAIRDRSGAWPTPASIAGHIGADSEHVRDALADLRRSGELVCRKRGSGRNQRREWMPPEAR